MNSFIHYVCTENNIGDEGTKALGEVLKFNTILTTLELGSIKTFDFNIFDYILPIHSYLFIYVYTDNNVGVEGAKVLGEALKYNNVLTTLYLKSIK